MFSSNYYRSPVTAPTLNPREKYLAALAEAKAAEAEYLAAEKLQQEEEALRQRLDQIQHLKQQQQQQPAPSPYYTPAQAHFPQPTPPPFPHYVPAPAAVDLDALRRQIAAEERARILQEQQQQVRREEALRLDEARKAQEARDAERARNLAAQNARLAALTQRALRPAVRYVATEGESARGDWEHRRPPPELRNRVNLTPYIIAEAAKKQGPSASCPCAPASAPKPKAKPEVKETNDLETLFGQLFGGQQPKAKPQPKKAPAPAPAPKVVSLDDLIHHVLGASQPQPQPQPKAEAKPQPKAEAKPQQQPAKDAPQTINLEQLLQHVLGGATVQPQPEATPKAPEEPAKEQAFAPTLEQIINHFLGAVAKPEASPRASASTSEPAKAEQPAPAPASAPAWTPAPAQSQSTPTPAAQAPHHAGVDFLNQLLSGAAARHSGSDSNSTPLNLQSLLNMYLDHAHPSAPTAQTPEAGPSNSAPAPARASAPSHKEQEERELAEAIRMSLAEAEAHPGAADKGKAPAPAPEKDIASSTAEVRAIDAQYTLLANEFVFPPHLDFTTSRSTSPTRNGAAGSEVSPVARLLSYSAANQPVRYYHQALSGLLARLDAVESFGDEGLRGMRKEVVGRVEGAMDEVERGVEERWRKVVGKVERPAAEPVAEPAPAAEPATQPAQPEAAPEAAAAPAPEPVAVENVIAEEPVVVEAEEAVVAEPETTAASTPAPIVESEPSPAAETELASSYPPVSESTSSIPTVVASPPYPAPPAPSLADDTAPVPSPPVELDVVDESLETLRPPTPTPPSPAPSSPSDIDTFLFPADVALADEKKARKAEDEHEVGSDWSEVDAL
ncbi:hypothetical protein DFH06DRAFT_1414091 [Mycena polygramma]|nr:hypothetical protein DFH06DRAFT_1414091 [Mycena polygramma]